MDYAADDAVIIDAARSASPSRHQRLYARPFRFAQPIDLCHAKLPIVWKLESHRLLFGNPY
jgi:hypothetical protein